MIESELITNVQGLLAFEVAQFPVLEAFPLDVVPQLAIAEVAETAVSVSGVPA